MKKIAMLSIGVFLALGAAVTGALAWIDGDIPAESRQGHSLPGAVLETAGLDQTPDILTGATVLEGGAATGDPDAVSSATTPGGSTSGTPDAVSSATPNGGQSGESGSGDDWDEDSYKESDEDDDEEDEEDDEWEEEDDDD